MSKPKSEPKPEPKPEPTKFACGLCGKELTPLHRKDGTDFPLRAFAEFGIREFGQTLCLDCVKQHYPDHLKKLAAEQ